MTNNFTHLKRFSLVSPSATRTHPTTSLVNSYFFTLQSNLLSFECKIDEVKTSKDKRHATPKESNNYTPGKVQCDTTMPRGEIMISTLDTIGKWECERGDGTILKTCRCYCESEYNETRTDSCVWCWRRRCCRLLYDRTALVGVRVRSASDA